MKERVPLIIASVSAMVLPILAFIGWVVFIAGFGIFHRDTEFSQQIDTLITSRQLYQSQEAANILRKLLFIPFNSYYILAAVSPVLFIFMLVKSFLLLCIGNNVARIFSIIVSVVVFVLGGFVLVTSGVILYFYSIVITTFRLNSQALATSLGVPAFSNSNTASLPVYVAIMFAGVLIEVIFVIAGLIAMHAATVLTSRSRYEADTSSERVEMK